MDATTATYAEMVEFHEIDMHKWRDFQGDVAHICQLATEQLELKYENNFYETEDHIDRDRGRKLDLEAVARIRRELTVQDNCDLYPGNMGDEESAPR